MTISPAPLTPGSRIRVVAPSVSLSFVEHRKLGHYLSHLATTRLENLGLEVTFGAHVRESDEFSTSPIRSRVSDLHEAFADPSVDGIMSVMGGFNSNELLPYLDFDLIADNPKFLCGYSDITALQNAIFAQTDLITYSGPHWSSFGMRDHSEITRRSFEHAAFGTEPIVWEPSTWFTDDQWFVAQDNRPTQPSSGWWIVQEGEAEGIAVGSNLSTFALLNGTEYRPELRDRVLFVEVTHSAGIREFRRMLESVLQQPGGDESAALVIGRFQVESDVNHEEVDATVASIPQLRDIPVIANADFGHTNPQLTFPIGGRAQIRAAREGSRIAFTRA
ncbi:S66 family peptidase [Corynebacterium flavescens]|uniref:S66 family peptidase n=1 Tax=Corynebacterium flavescens TaxID=28028 RepID=UPI003FD3A0FD